MAKRILIDAVHPEETRVVIADEKQIFDFDFVTSARKQVKGNIYLAKITRVEPSLQAAFVEYGGGKQGFLPFSEIHADYYQIPAADRQRLLEEAAREDADDEDAPTSAESAAQNAELSQTEAAEVAQNNASEEQFSLPALAEITAQPEETTIIPETNYMPLAAEPLPEVSAPMEERPATSTDEQPALFGEVTASEAKPAESRSRNNNNGNEASSEEDAVETIANEEEEVRAERKKRSFFKRYKIQEVIRRGQIVLIQVIKEERGNKGASLTTYLSLAGRYCVLMPNSPKDGGISRKIASPEDRKRLKAMSTEFRLAEGMSVIIRTAGIDRSKAEIKRDFDYLVKLWNHIRDVTLESTAPALIYEESDVIKRAIRDQYTSDIDELVIQGDEGFEAAKEFMKLLMPSHTSKIKQHKEATPIFYAYDVEDQLMSMHDPVVKLKSGGYIVINPTEALISIDVNSGRSTGERNIEETASKTNIEAAAEVARQLRLRDLAGLIVIDFIDMLESRNRRAVEKTLKDALKADRAKIQIGRISPFGLLEMSRQRLRPSISESNMVQCPHCVGRGYIRSNESMSIQIIRAIEKEASSSNWGSLRLIAPQTIALHILNNKRDILRAIEERYNLSIQVLINPDLTISEFNLEKMRRSNPDRGEKKRQEQRSRVVDANAIAAEISEQPYEEDAAEGNFSSPEGSPATEGSEEPRNRSRRGRRGGRNRRGPRENRDSNSNAPVEAGAATEENTAPTAETQEPQDNNRGERGERGDRNNRNRGGRGRRNWRGDDRGPKPSQDNNAANSNVSAEPTNVYAFAGQQQEQAAAPLPAFTQRPAVMEQPKTNVVNIPESTPRDPNAPPKRGWWQRMINLDE